MQWGRGAVDRLHVHKVGCRVNQYLLSRNSPITIYKEQYQIKITSSKLLEIRYANVDLYQYHPYHPHMNTYAIDRDIEIRWLLR